jgi:hypothetical protein
MLDCDIASQESSILEADKYQISIDANPMLFHKVSRVQLKVHLQTFLMAYNFARRLKALKGLTPYEFICKAWTNEPEHFKIDPAQYIVGLNILGRILIGSIKAS